MHVCTEDSNKSHGSWLMFILTISPCISPGVSDGGVADQLDFLAQKDESPDCHLGWQLVEL